jgi:hypothetical protein
MARPRTPLADRFWLHVNKTGPVVVANLGPCWEWIGNKNDSGYGLILEGGRRSRWLRAHRVSFFLAHGRWPEPCALHRCDNRVCVRPDHLYEGTRADNVKDMIDRDRYVVGVRHVGEDNGFAKLTNVQRAEARQLRANGLTFRQIGNRYGVTGAAIRYLVKQGVA